VNFLLSLRLTVRIYTKWVTLCSLLLLRLQLRPPCPLERRDLCACGSGHGALNRSRARCFVATTTGCDAFLAVAHLALWTVECHGELVSNTAGEIKEVVRPLILLGGHIIIDLGDVKHLDSAGLGALVGLKTSAINQGLCILELVNMTPGVLELLRITHLTQMFSS
jgi:anti-anti-sigma factor